MTSYRRILPLPYAFYTFKMTLANATYPVLGAKNNFSKFLRIQSRCLFIKKSIKNVKTVAESKKQHDLFKVNYVPNQTNKSADKIKELPPIEKYSSLSDIIKKIQTGPLDYKTTRIYLFRMIKLYRQLSFTPDFSTEMDVFVKSKEFEKLAQSLEQSMPMASIKYLYLMFQTMHYYQIPCSSILMQKLHALILDNINKFELPEVIKMYLIIKDKDEKLLKPLEYTFTTYFNHLTFDSLKLLGDIKSIAYFASKKEVPFSVREKILKKILSLGFQLKKFEPIMLAWLSNPLCSKEFQSLDKTHYLNALKETMDNFQYKDLQTVSKNITDGIHKGVINYDEQLCDTIANCACKYDLQSACFIMINLLKMGHVNNELAEVIVEKFIKSDIESLDVAVVENVINIFGLIGYKTYLKKNSDNWFKLEKILEDYMKPGINFKNLQTTLNLFVLELHSKASASKVLNDFAQALKSQEEVSGISLKRACLIYQCHCAFYSSPPENVPENFLSDCWSCMKDLVTFGWKEAMYEVFNGEEYVLENCKTPFGTLISYAVILGPDQKPINISSYKKPQHMTCDSFDDIIDIEKIQRSPSSNVFGFIEYTRQAIKFRNVPFLRSEPRLINEIHKNLGYRIFHLFGSQKISNVTSQKKILSGIMAREINFTAPENRKSSIVELTDAV